MAKLKELEEILIDVALRSVFDKAVDKEVIEKAVKDFERILNEEKINV